MIRLFTVKRSDSEFHFTLLVGCDCALALSELMSGLGFAVRVFDDAEFKHTFEECVC